jgi:hypothetical protein
LLESGLVFGDAATGSMGYKRQIDFDLKRPDFKQAIKNFELTVLKGFKKL